MVCNRILTQLNKKKLLTSLDALAQGGLDELATCARTISNYACNQQQFLPPARIKFNVETTRPSDLMIAPVFELLMIGLN